MVFCNIETMHKNVKHYNGHNPYFSRWFSAIKKYLDIPITEEESQSLF